jgi:hypothetical protein
MWLLLAQLTNSGMIFGQSAYFHSSIIVLLTVPAHQLAGLILGVLPGWVSMTKMVFGDFVEQNVLLILTMVFISFVNIF